MGEKAATNEVLNKVVSALGDESEDLRSTAINALGKMGEKAATNEVIGKLVVMMKSDNKNRWRFVYAIEQILNSSYALRQLDLKIIVELWWLEENIDCLKNISVEDLLGVFSDNKDTDYMSMLAEFALFKGVAVTASKEKVVLYGEKEPSELVFGSLEFHQQLLEAFRNQRKRLQLFFEMTSLRMFACPSFLFRMNRALSNRGRTTTIDEKREREKQQNTKREERKKEKKTNL
jgi:hypothetical protein